MQAKVSSLIAILPSHLSSMPFVNQLSEAPYQHIDALVPTLKAIPLTLASGSRSAEGSRPASSVGRALPVKSDAALRKRSTMRGTTRISASLSRPLNLRPPVSRGGPLMMHPYPQLRLPRFLR